MDLDRGHPGKRWGTRLTVLLGAIIVQLILGTVYGYSIFWQPLSAEVLPQVVTEASLAGAPPPRGAIVVADEAAKASRIAEQQAYLKYAFSICILSFAFTMVIAGRIQDITGPRLPALIGASLMGIGFLLAGMVNQPIVFLLAHAAFTGAVTVLLLMLARALFGGSTGTQAAANPLDSSVQLGIVAACVVAGVVLAQQYVGKLGEIDTFLVLWGTIGFLAGAGIGFAYVCPIAALVKWFPKQKGLVSGVAVAGFGLGAFLFKGRTLGALGFIEDHGIVPFFLVHAAICFVGVSAGAMLLKNPPESRAVSPGTTAPQPDSSWQATLRRPAFYTLWLMFFSGALAGLMVIGIVKVFAGEQLVAAAQTAGRSLTESETSDLLLRGAAAVGWLAIFNAVGRIAWGFVSDHIGRTAALVAMFTLQAVIMFLLSGMKTEASIAFAAAVVGFNFGGNFALFPSVTADLFGSRNLGSNYGWVFTSYGVAGVVGIAAGNAAQRMTGSYSAAFVLAGVLCVLSAGLAIGLAISRRRLAAPRMAPA